MFYILIRKISNYDGADLLLGIFDDRAKAEQCRADYLTRLKKTSDPWAKQSYRDVSPQEDTVIEAFEFSLDKSGAVAQTIYLVSQYQEGFGQIIRNYVGAFVTASEAEEYSERLDSDEEQSFPHYCLVDQIVLNEFIQPDYAKWKNS